MLCDSKLLDSGLRCYVESTLMFYLLDSMDLFLLFLSRVAIKAKAYPSPSLASRHLITLLSFFLYI